MTENCKPASHLNLIALFSAFSIKDADFDAFVVREVEYFVPGLVVGAICPVHVDGQNVSGLVEVDVEVRRAGYGFDELLAGVVCVRTELVAQGLRLETEGWLERVIVMGAAGCCAPLIVH